MKFTEKSKTQPGQAFAARDLIRRSLNGTMPAIFRDGSYDYEEDTYDNQESDDSFLDSEPQLEDVSALKDNYEDVKSAVDNYVAKVRKSHLRSKSQPKGASTSSEPTKSATQTVERNPATGKDEVH